MKKNFKKIVFACILLLSGNLYAQKDTIQLEEIYIHSSRMPVMYSESSRIMSIISREEIKLVPAQTVQDILQYLAGVDVRQRGAEGVQADLSLRGGSFEQVLVLLNGIKINDPQTGHHNLNIPIDIESIERIEILEGPAARVYGQNAFSGAINIITNSENASNIKINGFVGSYGLRKASIAANIASSGLTQHLEFSGKSSDGYTENTDFQDKNLFYHSHLDSKYGIFNIQAGYLEKNFGANNFYTTRFPNQYEEVNSGFASLKYSKGTEKWKLNSTYFWRRHKDYFLLKRDDPSFNQNNHLTDIIGSEYNFSYTSKLGVSALSLEYRKEKLLSSSMGDELDEAIEVKNRDAKYLKHYDRDVLSFSLEHAVSFKKFHAAGGLIANWNNDFGFSAYPGIDFNYEINDFVKVIASVNTSFRTPSFTELLYKDLSNIGNRELKPEEAISFEIGTKWNKGISKAQLSVFHTLGKEIIDWTKPSDDLSQPWLAQNISNLKTSGIVTEFSLFPTRTNKNAFVRSLKFAYTYLWQEASIDENFDSRYILDFLKHKASFGLQHKIYKNFNASWQVLVQDREGGFTQFSDNQFVEYEIYSLVNGKLSWENKFAIVYFDVNNLLNTAYYDFGNIPMPGRWFKLGAKITLFNEAK